MWSRRRFTEVLDRVPVPARVPGPAPAVAGSSEELARATRYLASPPTRLAEEATYWSSHALQVYVGRRAV